MTGTWSTSNRLIIKVTQPVNRPYDFLWDHINIFEQIEEVVEFAEDSNTPILEGKVVNIAYLLILRTGGMGKDCEKWEGMQVGQKNLAGFQRQFRTIPQALTDT